VDESGNLGITIVVKHDLPLLAGITPNAALLCCALVSTGSVAPAPNYELFYINIE
jgi:hypothetical protein